MFTSELMKWFSNEYVQASLFHGWENTQTFTLCYACWLIELLQGKNTHPAAFFHDNLTPKEVAIRAVQGVAGLSEYWLEHLGLEEYSSDTKLPNSSPTPEAC